MRRMFRFRNRPGAVLAVVAISLLGLLAIMALAIDMGMMYSARNEAQRVADAAALAGASEFFSTPPSEAEARRRAREFVAANTVLGTQVDTATESTILVNMAGQQVRVIIERQQIPTWFARVFGVTRVGVTAAATAEVSQNNTAGMRCVRPWGVQDMWHELDPNGNPRLARDGDQFGDDDGDVYKPVPAANPSSDPTATGYGSHNALHPHNNPGYPDYGRRIALHMQKPNSPSLGNPGPGEFLVINMPPDPTMETCSTKSGTNQHATFSNSVCGCNNNVIQTGVEYEILKTGNTVGWTTDGMCGNKNVKKCDEGTGLVGKDPNARWDEATGQVVGSSYADWRQSPRVVPIALIQPLRPGDAQNKNTVVFTNFALMFVESYDDAEEGPGQPSVYGRFLYYAAAENVPGQTGLSRRLRLIE